MILDKNALKRLIDKTQQGNLLVLDVSGLEKNSLQICQKDIEKYINKREDCTIILIKK